ncbi:MAG TPA: hypothetical protein VK120_02960 [Sporosarcina sp.]|nr:hypothetical protein [Sporosarcina sp.]
MLKSMLFAALLLNSVGLYLAWQHLQIEEKRTPRVFFWIGIISFLTICLIPILAMLLNPITAVLWSIISISLLLEVYSLIFRLVYGQLFAISLLLALVVPTIYSIGFSILMISILLLIIALFTFFNTKKLYIR